MRKRNTIDTQNRQHLGHKINIYRFKKIEISPYIPTGQNSTKLKIDNKELSRKYTGSWD